MTGDPRESFNPSKRKWRYFNVIGYPPTRWSLLNSRSANLFNSSSPAVGAIQLPNRGRWPPGTGAKMSLEAGGRGVSGEVT